MKGIHEQLKDSSIPSHIKPEYVRLLAEFEDTFSADANDIGRTDVTQHNIELPQGLNDPAYKGQFRLAFEHLQLIKDNVVGWLCSGLIERSNSKFNAPVFCVPKPHGRGVRIILDYRALNDKSVPDRYSIRTIDQCIEEIGRADSKKILCLDLTSGFWQLQLDPEHRKYTAFTVPGMGQFHWKVTPFGLMGGPASFSRLMDLIMEGAENVITYIDDVLIHSRSHQDHLKHLRVALTRIRQAHMRLNLKKCIFVSTSVQYLGHTVTANGVTPGKEKTCLLYTSPSPRDKRQSRMPSSA